MRHAALLALILIVTACSASDTQQCRITPAFFCAQYAAWDKNISEKDKLQLRSLDPASLKLSDNFERGVRNDFKLWQDNEVTRYFKENGLDNADYMSAPYVAGFVHYLKDEKVDMADISANYQPVLPPPEP